MSQETTRAPGRRDALENFLSPEEIIPYRPMEEKAWRRLRMRGFCNLFRHYIDWWRPWMNRGVFPAIAGYAWAGIYRSMRVPSIAAASFKNEGHFRARGRTSGTENFFGGAFRYPRSSPVLAQLIRKVNLRHHVAGVVARRGSDAEVMPHYEAAYIYVSTAFIESLRRGYESHGIPPDSKEGRRLGEDLCTILYQIAGMVGLTRMPKNLVAHEKFRDSYEAYLRKLPRSKWMESQARELTKRIFPFTAAMGGISLEDQRNVYLDREIFASGSLSNARATESDWPSSFSSARLRRRMSATLTLCGRPTNGLRTTRSARGSSVPCCCTPWRHGSPVIAGTIRLRCTLQPVRRLSVRATRPSIVMCCSNLPRLSWSPGGV